jgi:hypothetical protein
VQRFPDAGAKSQITSSGGAHPRWSADGREPIYWAAPHGLAAVTLAFSGDTVRAGTARTTHDVTAEWALNHQFVALHECRGSATPKDGRRIRRRAYVGWHDAKKRYVCYWLDAFGGGFAGAGYAEPRPNALPFVFGEAGGRFHNTFVFDPAARTWQWRMDNEHQGALVPFARVRLTRAADPYR